jgi:hypothetical protein
MDHKEKQSLVTAISLILIFALYSTVVYYNYIADSFAILDDFKFWGKAFLVLIAITIVSQIVIHIIFIIINKIVTNEDIETKTDERDKLIELKAMRIAHWVFSVGFLLSMISLALDMAPYIMLLSLICFGFIAGVISEFSKVYFYRKGC